jgi:hypothetical protein
MKSWLSFLLSASVMGIAIAVQGQNNASVPVSSQTVAGQTQVAQPPSDLTYSAKEVVKLHQSGIGDEIVSSYISNSNVRYQLSVADIVYMHQLGIADPLISSMILHDQQLRNTTAPYVAQAPAPAPAAQAPVAQPEPVAQPAPVQTVQPVSTVVVAPAAPTVTYVAPVYAAPYYAYPCYARPYPYYYGPAVRFGVGFGGHGGGVRLGLGFGF